MSNKIQQPEWHDPHLDPKTTKDGFLKVYNSLTRSKTKFTPRVGKKITWYICGPTVYDAAHMGHARSYMTFDIIRRILEEYFGYQVLYVMNITDIDDKIILRARQVYLYRNYWTKKMKENDGSQLIKELNVMLKNYVQQYFKIEFTTIDSLNSIYEEKKLDQWKDPKYEMHIENLRRVSRILGGDKANLDEWMKLVLESAQDIIAFNLDKEFGMEITDQKVFRDLASYWEKEFLKDMELLGVRPSDILTRVSEYVEKIVEYVMQIMKNGFAYETNGSIYFDTNAFMRAGYHYAKLEPWSAGNSQLLNEGEGAISLELGQKKSPNDFALWKKSKPGEPFWESPWSQGRPGWHIECTAMAGDILGESMDIHSGGIDLCFPHHDNELAQSEAYFGCKQWVNYFLHAGHLHIEGQKMSKSLKNFVTIRTALERYSARQIRLMFLLHTWSSVLDYKETSMEEAINVENIFKNFFVNLNASIREGHFDRTAGAHNYQDSERILVDSFYEKQQRFHEALCDSFDTPKAMMALLDIVSATNVYLKMNEKPNTAILQKVGKYITDMLKIFGVIESISSSIGFSSSTSALNSNVYLEEVILPYLQALADFRDQIRELARHKKEPKEILSLCDQLRDDILPELGLLLEDREGKGSLIKFEDKAVLLQRKQEKITMELEKQRQQLERLQVLEQKQQEKIKRARIPPNLLFQTLSIYQGQFSQYDTRGIPTHDIQGEPLSKSKLKKLEQEYQAHQKLHAELM